MRYGVQPLLAETSMLQNHLAAMDSGKLTYLCGAPCDDYEVSEVVGSHRMLN